MLLGWTVLPQAWLWTSLVIGIVLIPSLCASIVELLRKPDEVLLRQHLAAVAYSASRHFAQVAFELACLPYEAFYSLDAIARTAWRMLVAHRGLLEWNPSGAMDGEPAKRSRGALAASLRSMWVAPAIAAAAAIDLAAANPAALALAAPILLLWFASPVIAWWFSRPLARRKATLTLEQTRFLRALARRTWAFFETFVGPEDHWLPPDNYQEYRAALLVHRTSPTNMGLALLANLSAYDFGYLPAGPLIERTANTLGTMEKLERHRGHFYNWYDTQTLQPLPPLYVSTVDSGNLAGHLLTLRAGLLALADDRILPARAVRWLERHARSARGGAAIAQGPGVGVRGAAEDARGGPRLPRAPGRRRRRRSRRGGRGRRLGAGACPAMPRGAGRAGVFRPVRARRHPDAAPAGDAGRGAEPAQRAGELPVRAKEWQSSNAWRGNAASSRTWTSPSCSTSRAAC